MKKSPLTILQIHKFFRQQGLGGSIGSLFGLIDLLEENGRQVMSFSSKHELNRPSADSQYFIDPIDLSKNYQPSLLEKAKLIKRVIYSKEAFEKLDKLIKEKGKPDIAHLHLISYYLTPSILDALKKHKIPIIQTLHDYQLICPNHRLYTQRRVCERCKKQKYYHCFLNKCVQDSFSRSFLAMLERYYNRVLNDYAAKVDLFIAPSQFLKDKAIEFGIDPKKITVFPNYVSFAKEFGQEDQADQTNPDSLNSNNDTSGPYGLYFGRLAEEKGVATLIQALGLIKDKNLELLIAGSGPSEASLKNLTQSLNLNKRIKFLGFKNKKELAPLIKKASFVICPSEWYENAPLSIYESFYFKKPVIASNIGGLPELVKNEETGFLFEPGNKKDLALKIDSLTPEKAKIMGLKAQEFSKQKLTKENYYEKLIEIYNKVIRENA